MYNLLRTKFGTIVSVASITTLLAGCSALSTRDRFDEDQKYKQVDANEVVKKQSDEALKRMEELVASLERKSAPLPEQVVPPVFNPLEELKVSLVVENGELQYILKALADQTKMNLLIHPNLLGNSYKVSVDFRDVSALTVFEQLTRIADVDGKIEGNTLIINPMKEKIFQLGFMETSVSNTFSSGGDVLGGGGGGGGGSSSSSTSGGNEIKGEFSVSGSNMPSSNPYTELETMLDVLVGKPEKASQHSGVSSASNIDEIGMLSRLGTAIRNDLPLYSLNRMTGTLFVRAKPSVMNSVTNIVDNYEAILGGQILIDAQIVEVKLDDEFKLGIDWSNLRSSLATSFSSGQRTLAPVVSDLNNIGQGLRSFSLSTPTIGGNVTPEFAAHYVGNSLAIALETMQHYGDVSVLSNPTLRSKHGQPAIISVGTSAAYISDTRVVTNGGSGTSITSQEVQTAQVFDGLMIGVVPFIDRKGEISLSIHPVQSKVDPASLALVDAGGDSKVTLPVVELKSMVTQVKVRSGDLIVMGGLIDQVDTRQESGLPGLGGVPFFGNLFKQRNNVNAVRELVLLLKVTRL